MSRYSSPGHPFSSAWWAELTRFLRLRPGPSLEKEGLSALFIRKRQVHPREISTSRLSALEHAAHIADRLKYSRPAIINLEDLVENDRLRALDFISGAAYALDGSYEKIGEHIFLFVPGSVTITEDE